MPDPASTTTSLYWLSPVASGLFSLAGVWLGSYLNQRNSFQLQQEQKEHELRIRLYARLLGLKPAYLQAVRTHLEAKALCEYYETRSDLEKNGQDLEEAKRQNERALGLIEQIANLRREMCEVLGEIGIVFKSSPQLDSIIDHLLRHSAIGIAEFKDRVTNRSELEALFSDANKQIGNILEEHIQQKLEDLATVLRGQIKAQFLNRRPRRGAQREYF